MRPAPSGTPTATSTAGRSDSSSSGTCGRDMVTLSLTTRQTVPAKSSPDPSIRRSIAVSSSVATSQSPSSLMAIQISTPGMASPLCRRGLWSLLLLFGGESAVQVSWSKSKPAAHGAPPNPLHYLLRGLAGHHIFDEADYASDDSASDATANHLPKHRADI